MRLLFYTLILGFLSVTMQQFVPGVPWLGNARPALPALAVIYAALSLRDLRVVVVATVIGFYIDAMCQNRLGVSVISLSVVAALILTQTQGRLIQRIDFQMLVVLVGTFLFMSLDYIFYLMQIWSNSYSPGDWALITFGSILNALLSPFLFALFNLPSRLLGWSGGRRQEYGYAAR